jgi:hypothetical protein
MEGEKVLDENERLRQLAALDKSVIPADGGPAYNRLIFAASPYLLQHADNPVDWYQWGDEAFTRARAEDKPVFLSIGYATCHWCHVMAHESFEDRQVAEALNRNFVAIKVDREERPDIDDQYMKVAQIISGSGGWPLNIIMTADKRPFFAATYLPKTRRMGMPGIIELLDKISEFWQAQPEKVAENCAAIMDAMTRLNVPTAADRAGMELEESAFQQLAGMYDESLGGFGNAPKFPMPHYISFLLRLWKISGSPEALRMAEQTLTTMRRGGIYDQVGFGFHRYSVDRQWLVPHFEKMLYDQALLAIAYAEAFQATGNDLYRDVVREILTYALREMVLPEGGFCSAQDADTEGEEGRFYLWTPDGVAAVLGAESAPVFCRLFDVTQKGNFEGRNILHLPLPLETFAEREGVIPELLRADVARWRGSLLAERDKRIRPLRDAKALTAWNGLLIAALAKGYGVCGDDSFIQAADRAVAFVGKHLRTPEGRLLRSYHLESATIPAFLEDYAFFVWGLIELYQVTLSNDYLEEAILLSREMLRIFAGEDGGGLFESGADAEEVLLRQKSAYDGVLPSGNSVAAMNLMRLGRICEDPALQEAGEAVVREFLGSAVKQPAAYLQLLMAHEFQLTAEVAITLVGEREREEMKAMLAAISKRFIPHLVLRHADKGDIGGFTAPAEGGAAYVCAGGACRTPVATAEELERLLDEVA